MVIVFCTLTVNSAFAEYTEEDADTDRDQQRAVLAAIGLVALVGAIFLLTKLDFAESYKNPIEKKPKKNNFKFDIDFIDSSFNKHDYGKKEPAVKPCLKFTYSW